MMHAYALTQFGADALEWTALPEPSAQAGQVVVRNRAAGVNNIDLMIRRGGILPPEATPLPHVLGVEGAGTIERIGPGVEKFSVGDRVFWFGRPGAGGYGTHTVIDAACAARIADHVSFEIAAAAPVAYATARNAIYTYGAPDPGAWLLIHSAAGGVGTAALQVARNAGLRTIALTTPEKFDHVRARGADVAFDYRADDLVASVRNVTEGAGVALSLNTVAGATILRDLEMLGNFGQVISFGHLGGLPAGSATDLLMPHFSKCVGIRVSDIYTMMGSREEEFSAMLTTIAADLEAGAIKPQLHVVLPAAKAMDGHAALAAGAVRGKIVLSHD